MNPTITAFAQSPDRGRGLARDMAVRWAFEEVGQPYDVRPLTFAELKQPAHRLLQPFGQIPTYQDEGLALFGSAAIVLHITELHGALLPIAPKAARARSRGCSRPRARSNLRSASAAWQCCSRLTERGTRSD